jgi:class 3 adenylate cyclase/tetratricopeptide (TPR) repeat protein
MNHWASLSAYIPFDRQASLINQTDLPTSSTGTVLFADIAGYTPLSRLFSDQLGSDRGAEALTQQLNKFHTTLITELHRYRGSVLSFSGDAITCWIEGDMGERALMVAINMQKAFEKIKRVEVTLGHSAEVGLKVAITYGAVQRFLIGDPKVQYIDTIAGDVLDRVAAGEHLAVAGDIIIGRYVQEHLKERVDIAEYRTDSAGEAFAIVSNTSIDLPEDPWPEFVHENLEVLEEWVVPAIVEHLAAGDASFLTELRDNSALFLSFSGIDYDNDPAAGEKLDRFVQYIQDVFVRYEAYLIQLTIGEKGSYLLASFGALIAHEDDSSRAVSAALEIVSAAKQMDSIDGVRIGISQGVIRAGTYGAPKRKTYGVQGAEINFAARLMQQAEDYQIVVSKRIVSQSPGFQFAPLALTKFKGFVGEIQTYEVTGRIGTFDPQGNIEVADEVVGRVQELEEIISRLSSYRLATKDQLADPVDQTLSAPIIIEGEAGMGKSVLLRNALSGQEQKGLKFWVGAADAVEQTTPYFVWRPILETIFGIHSEMSHTELELAVTPIFHETPFLLDRLPLLQDTLPVQWADNKLTASLSGAVRAENIRDFIFGTLKLAMAKEEAAGIRPVLVIEDAHWLDSPSVSILARIRREIPELMLIVVTRPVLDEIRDLDIYTLLENLRKEPLVSDYRLNSLLPHVIDALIQKILGVINLPGPVQTLIRSRAEGNPFYSVEIAYALRDLGFIEIKNEEILFPKGAEFENLRFPNTIQGVITSRIDKLSPSEQLTAKTASVIGRSFEVEALTHIHPATLKKQIVIKQMSSMADLAITLIDQPAPDLSYMFKHVITRDVAYSLLPFEQRRSLHKRVAEMMEASDVDASQMAPLLVHHWKRAEVIPKISSYLLMAGKQAARNGSFREADKSLSELLEMEADGRLGDVAQLEKAEWQWLLGRAKYGLGQLNEARELFELAVTAFDQPVPQSGFKLGGSIMRNAAVQVLHRRNPERHFDNATDEQRHRYRIAMQIYRDLNDIYFYMEEKIRLLYVGVRQINIAENAGHSPWLPQANAVMGVITALFGLGSVSENYFERAMVAAGKVEEPAALGTVLLGNSLIKVGNGEFSTVYSNAEEGLAIFERLGHRKDWGDTMATYAFSQFFEGNHATASQSLVKLLDSTFQTEHTVHEIWARTWLGAIAYREGDNRDAEQILDKIAPLFKKTQDKVSEISYRGIRALTYFQLDEIENAEEEFEKAVALIDSTNGQPSGYFSREGYTAVCEYALTQLEKNQQTGGDKRLLEGRVKKALKAMKTFSGFFVIGKPALYFYQGWQLELWGKVAKSIELYQKGLDEAIELGLAYEIVQITKRLVPLLSQRDTNTTKMSARAEAAKQKMSAS